MHFLKCLLFEVLQKYICGTLSEKYFLKISFSKEHFQEVNGYSNEYWGVGYEDYDLLLRCVVKGLSVRTEIETPVSKTYGSFNGTNSYIEIPSENAKIKNTTNKSFSTFLSEKTVSIYLRVASFK